MPKNAVVGRVTWGENTSGQERGVKVRITGGELHVNMDCLISARELKQLLTLLNEWKDEDIIKKV